MVDVCVLPARSVASAVIVFAPQTIGTEDALKPDPSVAPTPLTETLNTPLRASESLPLTVMVEAIVLELFAGDEIATSGFILSTLKAALVTPLVALPATSLQPSEVTVMALPSPVV